MIKIADSKQKYTNPAPVDVPIKAIDRESILEDRDRSETYTKNRVGGSGIFFPTDLVEADEISEEKYGASQNARPIECT